MEEPIADLKVRVEELPRMWVASVQAGGEAPENEAWRRLRAWAGPQGLITDADRHPIFGFNNPAPSPGKKGYVYELWIRVDSPETGEDAVVFKEFEGGLFAVTACRLLAVPDIGDTWRQLWGWTQASPYCWRRAQELEKVLNPDAAADEVVLELYLPIQPHDSC